MDVQFFYFVALVLLLALSAFFSGSEAALFSLTRAQLRHLERRSPAGREVGRLLEKPRKVLISILLGNLIVNIFTTSAATSFFLSMFGPRGLGYAFVLMSALIMLLGEILPKTIALHGAERFATGAVFPLRVFHTLVLPLRLPLSRFSDAVIGYLRRRLGQAKRFFTWDELITALRIARAEGEVGRYEYEMLSNVLEFRQKIVKEIMTPSIHVLSASTRARRGELLRMFKESGYSRMPITGESTDDVIGMLHIKDLVDPEAASSERDLRSRLRAPFFVQESSPIAQLYGELQASKGHVAVVLDEFGSFAGIVTIEDILEELVGEIRDARDPKTEPFMRLDEHRIVVSGTMEIDQFNAVFGTALADEEHETVAGYVIGSVGRIPKEGETIEAGGLKFQIISARPNRVRKIRVEKP